MNASVTHVMYVGLATTTGAAGTATDRPAGTSIDAISTPLDENEELGPDGPATRVGRRSRVSPHAGNPVDEARLPRARMRTPTPWEVYNRRRAAGESGMRTRPKTRERDREGPEGRK